jgi:hypothetical protein
MPMRRFGFIVVFLFLMQMILSIGVSLHKPTPHTQYAFSSEPIDVVIPCCKKDQVTLNYAIEGIRKYGNNIRRIIVVSKEKLTDQAEWFNENLFPFSFNDLAHELCIDLEKDNAFLEKHPGRKKWVSTHPSYLGWVFQQLIKFYSVYVIPGISSNVLVLDSDTIFLKPITFTNSLGATNFNVGTEYHKKYFQHARRLLPHFKKLYPKYSGICHFMLLQKPVLDHLFTTIQRNHHLEFWKAFCQAVPKKNLMYPCASEYEIYFNFALAHSDQFSITPLYWKNSHYLQKRLRYQQAGYNYVSFHAYLSEEK